MNARKNIAGISANPGVYLFYDENNMLLYIGKSKNIRARVRAHFNNREEKWLTKCIDRIDVRETAGELGALLLESQLIKEMRPMHNVRSRQPRRIIIARCIYNDLGYATVKLEPVDYVDIRSNSPILGIFKHKTQAKDFLDAISKKHNLCPKLLRLENSTGHCFSYHLKKCNGACMGEEDAAGYNRRVDSAFEARRIAAWPFEGPIDIEEFSKDKKLHEIFQIDNWCLVAIYRNGKKNLYDCMTTSGRNKSVTDKYRFDYDSYKIIYAYVMEKHSKTKKDK